MKLNDMKVAESARIVAFDREITASYRQKLIALGLRPGVTITLVRTAPLGDPVEIQVGGMNISLRKQEADIIDLEKVSA